MGLTINIENIPEELLEAVAKKVIDILDINNGEVSIKKEPSYSVRDVAVMTNKTTQTIGHHIRKGILIATKPGRDYLITETNLNKYLNGE